MFIKIDYEFTIFWQQKPRVFSADVNKKFFWSPYFTSGNSNQQNEGRWAKSIIPEENKFPGASGMGPFKTKSCSNCSSGVSLLRPPYQTENKTDCWHLSLRKTEASGKQP